MGMGLAAQEAAVRPAGEEKPKRPLDTLALVDQARGLPPEFSADLLLKLAASPVIGDAGWKRELIEEAFSAGKSAQLPFRRIAWRSVAVESRISQENYDNGIDALALQTRAVEAMLILDAQKALSMFEEIQFQAPLRAACEDPAIPRPDAYYSTAVKVFASAFNSQQREKEEDLWFLEQRIRSMSSPAQVPKVLGMIFNAQLSPERRKTLLTSFAVALEQVRAGGRMISPFEAVPSPQKAPEIALAGGFMSALRAYVARQASAPRCSDGVKEGVLTSAVKQFNSIAAQLDPQGNQFKPIREDELKLVTEDEPSRPMDGGANAYQSDRSRLVLTALKWLTHGNRMRPDGISTLPWTLEERKTVEWNVRCLEALELIDGWRETEETSPEDYLIMVADTYAALTNLIPPGSLRETMMRRYLVFLEVRYTPDGKRNLWFSQLKRLLSRVRSSAQDPAERAWLLERLQSSNNPIIAAYARIEALLGS